MNLERKIAGFGVLADDGLDMLVDHQRKNPRTFREVVDTLMKGEPPGGPEEQAFFIAMVAATAIIRLAAQEEG